MKATTKSMVAGALALGVPMVAQAESPHSFSANVALTSDYLFRGISQTTNEPALQGGFDYAYDSGDFATPYVGIWASSIDFGPSPNGDNAAIEVDYYGGLAGSFANGINWDVGGIYYHYPSQDQEDTAALNGGKADFDYVEAYLNLDYTIESLEYSPTLGFGYAYSPDFFGEDGDGNYVSGTLDLSLPYGLGLGFLIGYQDVEGDKATTGFDYFHYSIGLSKDIGIFTADLSWNDSPDEDADGCFDCEDIVMFSVSSSF